MKPTWRVVLTLSLLAQISVAFSQSPGKELDPGYYVVVGAYASTRENIAQNYVEVLNRQGVKAAYGYNAVRKMYFVYIERYGDLKGALKAMNRVRKEQFRDAWVRVVPGVVRETSTPLASTSSEDPPSSVSQTSPAITNQDRAKSSDTVPSQGSSDTLNSKEPEITDNDEIKQYPRMTLGNTEVFLSLFDARNNRIVSGDVHVIDTERSKSLTKVKGNEYLLLPDPKSKSGQLTLICEAFGYRKVQQEINYPLPLADTIKPFIDLMGTTIVINFDLVRYHKGDIATLYNVYFYNDAALMLPESKFELNSLLAMLQENPKYKIRLHGHTNGNYHGRILTVGPDKNLFSLDGATNSMGSAKDLSRLRAEAIRDYLAANGVQGDRIEIKAWGGKRPLYDRNSVNAKRNVRVEVEILAD